MDTDCLSPISCPKGEQVISKSESSQRIQIGKFIGNISCQKLHSAKDTVSDEDPKGLRKINYGRNLTKNKLIIMKTVFLKRT